MNIIWTDGSSGKSGKMGWAAIGQVNHLTKPVRIYGHGIGSNQKAELVAVIEAIRLMPDDEELLIITDSMYVIRSATEWRKTWESCNYVNWQGQPLSNKELIIELHRQTDRVCVTFQHVRGHTGEEGNELADAIAHLARKVAEGLVDKSHLLEYNMVKSYGYQEDDNQNQARGSSETTDTCASSGQRPRGQEEIQPQDGEGQAASKAQGE